MASCELCGGLGQVAAGGMINRFAGVFGTTVQAGVHECGRCHGTGRAGDAGDPVPRPRTAARDAGLGRTLAGDWRVEIHGSGRILAVMRFGLGHHPRARRFDARCDFGGLPGWQACGEWTTLDPGNVVWFSGTQSSLYVPSAEYRWGATLDERERGVLHGDSVSAEWTTWTLNAEHLSLTGESPIDPPAADEEERTTRRHARLASR
jgi:hypothetical protein